MRNIKVSWTAPPNPPDGYILTYYSDVDPILVTVSVLGTEYTLVNVLENVTYHFTLMSKCGERYSDLLSADYACVIPYTFYRFIRCDSSYCYMPQETYDYYISMYGAGYFQAGNRYYGAVEGDPTYLYTYVGPYILYDSTPDCTLTGVSATTDTCP